MFRVGNFIRLGKKKNEGERDKRLNVTLKGKHEGTRKANNQNSITRSSGREAGQGVRP